MVDAASEIFLEMVESENVAVDEAAVERFFHQGLQIDHAEHCNGALPTDPDIALCLWSHFSKGIAKKTACHCPVEFSPNSDHSEGFAHARPNEFFGVRVQDDVVERLKVAIEQRRHNAVARGGDPRLRRSRLRHREEV